MEGKVMSKRIYHVKSKHGAVTKQYLVKTHTPASAISHVAGSNYTAEPATQDTLVKMIGEGHKVIEPGVEQVDAFEEGDGDEQQTNAA
jgi:hypothetical protein